MHFIFLLWYFFFFCPCFCRVLVFSHLHFNPTINSSPLPCPARPPLQQQTGSDGTEASRAIESAWYSRVSCDTEGSSGRAVCGGRCCRTPEQGGRWRSASGREELLLLRGSVVGSAMKYVFPYQYQNVLLILRYSNVINVVYIHEWWLLRKLENLCYLLLRSFPQKVITFIEEQLLIGFKSVIFGWLCILQHFLRDLEYVF